MLTYHIINVPELGRGLGKNLLVASFTLEVVWVKAIRVVPALVVPRRLRLIFLLLLLNGLDDFATLLLDDFLGLLLAETHRKFLPLP